MITSCHVILAVLLFFCINWLGKHSSTFGYLQLSLNPAKDEAPAFNFALKTLAPSVYVILISTVLYLIHFEKPVREIWLVTLYYFLFRVLYNVILERAVLLNWVYIIIQTTVGVAVAYLAYAHLILPRHPLLPNAESIGEQLWVIIALFFYAALTMYGRRIPALCAEKINTFVRDFMF